MATGLHGDSLKSAQQNVEMEQERGNVHAQILNLSPVGSSVMAMILRFSSVNSKIVQVTQDEKWYCYCITGFTMSHIQIYDLVKSFQN